MIKTIYLRLFICISALLITSSGIFSQNDAYLDIGNLRIRYDRDSNTVRFGVIPVSLGIGNLRLSKELNGQLFKFRSSDFAWSTTEGLILQNTLSHDTVWSNRFTITKDTGDGEVVPTQRRAYTMKKLFWNNDPDQWSSLKLYYYSWNTAGVLAGVDSTKIINDAFLKTNDEIIGLSNTYANKDTIKLTYGKWLINCNVSFTFIDATAWTALQDSIFCRLSDGTKIVPGSSQYAVLTYEDHGRMMGMSGQLTFSVVIDLNTPSRTYYLQMKTETQVGLIHFGNRDNITCTQLR